MTEESRRSFVHWLRDVVGRSYGERGLGGMLAQGPRFVREDLLGERLRWALLTRPLRGRLLDRASLRQRAAAADRLWDDDRPDPFTIDALEGQDLPDPLTAETGTVRPERPFVAELRDVRLLGADAIGLDDGQVVLETASASEMFLYFALSDLYETLSVGRSRLAAYRAYREVLDSRSSMRFPDPPDGDPPKTAVAFIPYWRNYYHWTIEFLPKVRLLERYEAETGRQPTILLEPDPPAWILESLRLTGWDVEDCTEWIWPEARIDRLVVPVHRNHFIAPHDSRFGDDFNPVNEDVIWLAERMQSNVPSVDGGEFSRRVYVSRKDTTHRPVANEAAVEDTLASLGFESYTLTEYSISDQIRLFAGAEAVVAPHGAGLVNVLHSSNLSVLELFPENNVEPYYFCLARQLGFEYDCGVYATRDEAMVVDTDDLRERATRLIGTP
ncbi:glycosyltransferase family 61 protein [Halapricum desulfuricans]|nr:glycosyltransferase family 61 protein [Halapricum desulfuricans]